MRHPCEVSVIIATLNRSQHLAAALRALLNQAAAPPHELIVVDNGSTDGTRALVEALQQDHPQLRYLHQTRAGLAHARNAGIEAAAAPILAFTDDHVKVTRNWVASIVRAFGRYPDVDGLGGPVLPRWPPEGLPPWLTRRQLAPLGLQDKGTAPMRVDRRNAAPCLVGSNIAFRRSAFEKAGLFSADHAPSDDREFQLRLWKAGGSAIYTPDIVAQLDMPHDRLARAHFRRWYGRAGRVHARMGLLDVLDAGGRLVDRPGQAECVGGVPPFLYWRLARDLWRTVRHLAAAQGREAFYHENRARYVGAYILERWRERRLAGGRGFVRDLVALSSARRKRPTPLPESSTESPEVAT